MNPDDDLSRAALGSIAKMQAALAALIFGPAWSLAYWQGWLYWLVILTCVLPITLYLLRHDPDLVRRRAKAGATAERRPQQKLIQALASITLVATIVVSALDHGQGWSFVPWPVAPVGDALVVAGFAIVFAVFRENSFASSIIEVADGQPVIDTGPYAVVRHPMYSGSLLLFAGTPLALGSWWGLLPAVLVTAVIVWRLLDEEQFLAGDLEGYAEYRDKVRWRLVPGLW